MAAAGPERGTDIHQLFPISFIKHTIIGAPEIHIYNRTLIGRRPDQLSTRIPVTIVRHVKLAK